MTEPEKVVIVAMGEGPESVQNKCTVTDKELLRAWNESLKAGALKDTNVEQVAFPGKKKDLDSILRCIQVNDGDNWPMTIQQIRDAFIPCYEWGMHPSLVSTISYYLHDNISTPAIEKLKWVARCGDPLLMAGLLHFHCSRTMIINLVKRSPKDYKEIVDSPKASYVLEKMLRYVAEDGDESYKQSLQDMVNSEVAAFKDRCKQMDNFDGAGVLTDPSQCRLQVSSDESSWASYVVNRAYLASWSPVFRSMFYSDFADRRQDRVQLVLSNGEKAYWPLFLNLIHPSYACALWRLLPVDDPIVMCGDYATSTFGKRITKAFPLLFGEGGIDALMQVFRLAHRYQVTPLVKFCEATIKTKSEMPLVDKILLADTYDLDSLLAWCMGKLTTGKSVKKLFTDNQGLYGKLTCQSHKKLFERMLELA